jgi:hypothetical protein
MVETNHIIFHHPDLNNILPIAHVRGVIEEIEKEIPGVMNISAKTSICRFSEPGDLDI